MPDVPMPEELPSEAEVRERILPMMPDPVRKYYERERPIELRPVEFERYRGKKFEDGRFNVWIRTTGRLPDDPAIHQCVLVLRLRHDPARHRAGAARPHAVRKGLHGARASITRCGCTGRSAPTTGCCIRRTPRTCRAARGFARGLIFTRDGKLVASVAQEGLIRERAADLTAFA